MTKKLLDRADVVTRFEEMCSERIPECVTADVLDQTGRARSFLNGPLQDRFVGVVVAFVAGHGVLPMVLLRKDPLPTPFGASAPKQVRSKRDTHPRVKADSFGVVNNS